MEDEPSQYLETYVDATEVLPDVILCPSKQCQREAEQLGFDTVRLPLGMESFRPLGLDRSGLGFAGAEHQRNSHKMDITIDPFRDDIEWVSDFVIPEQLNVWYNTKLITFGTHKEGQRQWGMVNNRVFETLGSGTPLVLESHPAIEDVLGIDYPYQTGSREETIGLVERIRENPGETVDDFAEIAEHIRKNHRYEHRVETLVDTLS